MYNAGESIQRHRNQSNIFLPLIFSELPQHADSTKWKSISPRINDTENTLGWNLKPKQDFIPADLRK